MNLVSVIIPVYNAEKYLHECLDSVINQSLKDIEIICVNDASTDNSLAILEEYASRDSRITILNNEINLHAGTSRNRGIEMAKGEYIHFLDADDYVALDAYENLYYKAKANNVDMLKFKAITFDSETKVQLRNPYIQLSMFNTEDYIEITNFYKEPYKLSSVPVTPWSGIYKRSFLLANKLLFNDLMCANDVSFYISVILKAKAVMFIDYNALYYRVNTMDSLSAIRPNHFECQLKSFYIVKELCGTLPYDLKNLILSKEISGLFSQLISFQNKRALNSATYESAQAFFRELDVDAFEKQYGFCHWCKQYFLQNSFNSFKLKRKLGLDAAIKHTYRFIALCKNKGWKYALRKTKTILSGEK